MPLIHGRGRSFLFVVDNFFTALVKVHIEEDHLFNIGHVIDPLEVEIDFVTSKKGYGCENSKSNQTYSFLKSLSV